MKKVLITDDVHPCLIEGLIKRGYDCDYLPNITDAEVRKMIAPYQGLVINSKIFINQNMLDLAPQLSWVARLGSGLDVIDLKSCEDRGVRVISSPEGNCDSVAEHALGLLLGLANNLTRADREVRAKNWQREKNRGFELQGKTIGIWGFGHTGTALAKRLKGFNMRVLTYDKYKKEGYTSGEFEEVLPEVIFREADIVSFHLQLTPETDYLVNADFLNRFEKNIYLVNTSRGRIVNTEDLIQAMETGKVKGAALDVFENEKPQTFTANENEMYQKLYEMENVILSPHIAGWTVESKKRLSEIILEKLTVDNGELIM